MGIVCDVVYDVVKKKTVQISVRVDKDLLDWVDEQIGNMFFKDRTHAVNMALQTTKQAIEQIEVIKIPLGKTENKAREQP